MQRAYYNDSIINFLNEDEDSIMGKIVKNSEFDVELLQKNAWLDQIRILKEVLNDFNGIILFEYTIPRMGKRADNILLLNGNVIVLEFKVGENKFKIEYVNQALDYALDLKYFHKESHNLPIFPDLICTEGEKLEVVFSKYHDNIYKPIRCNKDNLKDTLNKIILNSSYDTNMNNWINSPYSPTPTIIEAAQALYKGHDVKEISRSDSEAINLSKTTEVVNAIIEKSKIEHLKSICFITGVPGAGKTLAGLNIANERHNFSNDEHAVFLSGNGPLVKVLQEALARYDIKSSKIRKFEALSKTKAFIQNIHNFRDEALKNTIDAPVEKVVIFDEAQRAWNKDQTSKFMKQKKGNDNFNMSEPEFLISVMDRHKDWAVIICLIGNGQEINTGEAGINEWFKTIELNYQHWNVYLPEISFSQEYNINNKFVKEFLHLNTSIRSFRSEYVSNFVAQLLSNQVQEAKNTFNLLKVSYPIFVTRNLNKAKMWLQHKCRGSERMGIVASSNAMRLKPYGIYVQNELNVCDWFLNSSNDIRSSNYLENVASEFEVQGLELDWVCIAWDANLRYNGTNWLYYNFSGTRYNCINKNDRINYLINSYRVLLTRARQGMIIFIPEGDNNDMTRLTEYYDHTYDLFKLVGLKELL